MTPQERRPQLLDGWLPVSWVVLMVWLVFVDLVVPVVSAELLSLGCLRDVAVWGLVDVRCWVWWSLCE